MRKEIWAILGWGLVCLAGLVQGGEVRGDWKRSVALDSALGEVAGEFARALKRPDMIVGVYEVPSRPVHTVLPSGEILEATPGYWETMIRGGMCKMYPVQIIKGSSNPVIFVVTSPVIYDFDTPKTTFIAYSGSRWLLALESYTNHARWKNHYRSAPTVIRDNLYIVSNKRRGAACLKLPESQKPGRRILMLEEEAVEDLKRLRDWYCGRKEGRNLTESEVNQMGGEMRTDFGRAVLWQLWKGESEGGDRRRRWRR